MIVWSAGHIADMIGRIKANEALIRRKRYFKTIKKYRGLLKAEGKKLELLTKEEKEKIKMRVLLEREKEIRNAAVALLVSMLLTMIIVTGIFLLYVFLRKQNQ